MSGHSPNQGFVCPEASTSLATRIFAFFEIFCSNPSSFYLGVLHASINLFGGQGNLASGLDGASPYQEV